MKKFNKCKYFNKELCDHLGYYTGIVEECKTLIAKKSCPFNRENWLIVTEMDVIKLSEIIDLLPKGLGIFIGAKAKEYGKRYCYGQPQIKNGEMVFCDSRIEGIRSFRGLSEFSILFIDCSA